jgi:hypothetical protein
MQFPVGQPRSSTSIRTEMTLSLQRRADRKTVWEGRASTTATGTPAPQTVALLTRALMADFPGPSGATVRWVAK